ncbi:MAG TPA: hypothetical protein VFA38_06515 [Nitrospirales bacterium]|nr:hypothetical protein [Nitrospirales bacterium]
MPRFTPEELRLLADAQFFATKSRLMGRVRGLLEETHAALRAEVAAAALTTPDGFNPAKVQFVKGEHLEDCPYQYLDFPKHFAGGETFTFRTLFWWGHAFVFALLLEGDRLLQYKQNLINRYHQVAGRELEMSLAPSLWEWKQGAGYTIPITHDHKSQISAVLSGRRSVKLARFVSLGDPAVQEGRVAEVAVQTFRALLPVITT